MTKSVRFGLGIVLIASAALLLGTWLAKRGTTSPASVDESAPSAEFGQATEIGLDGAAANVGPDRVPRTEVPDAGSNPRLARTFTLEGALHDRSTGEALFDFEVGARLKRSSWTTLPSVRSDVSGKFSFGELDFEPDTISEVQWSLIDDASIKRRSSPTRVALERSDVDDTFVVPAQIAVDVGPTIGLEMALPSDTTWADFRVHHRSGPSAAHDSGSRYGECAVRSPLSFGPHAGRAWVRFGDPITTRDRVWVEVRSVEPGWSGGAWLTQLAGVVAQPLAIRLERSTRVFGRFVWPSDHEFEGVGLRLYRRRDGRPVGVPKYGFVRENGEFSFEDVRPGAFRLVTADAGWKPFELDLEVLAGDNDVGLHTLVPRAVVGAVRGVVRSASGRFEGACHISLSDHALSHDAPFDHSLDFEPVDADDPESELIARFEFENVTEGDWWLYVHCHDGFEFPRSVQVVRAPLEGFEIVLDDRALSARITLVEAESGTPCEGSVLRWSCGEASDTESGPVFGIDVLPDAAERFEWVAIAPGRRAARGTGLAFTRAVTADGRTELVGRVELTRGFGRRVLATSRSDGTPIAGIEVRCDGELVGVTDTAGRFDIVRDDAPARISFAASGWVHVSSNDFDARSGAYSADADLWAQFEPERP